MRKRNLAIDPAEGHVVDLVAKRRNIGSFGRVDLHAQHVFAIGDADAASAQTRTACIRPCTRPERTPLIHTVDAVIAPSKSTKTRLPSVPCRQLEAPPIGGDELVVLIVEAVPGQLAHWYAG